MNQRKNSAWFYNKTRRDIIISELGLKLLAGQALDFFKHKKDLRPEMLRHAERFGSLSKKIARGDIIKLSGPPSENISIGFNERYVEATEPVYSKVKSSIEIDSTTKDFVDQLQEDLMKDISTMSGEDQARLTDRVIKEVSVDNLEGFADPLKED